MAAKAGKDIYCEKPLSLTIRQGQAMVKAVRAAQARSADRQPCIAPARPTASPASWSATAGSARSSGSSPRWPRTTRSSPGPGLEADARARGIRLRDVAGPGARRPPITRTAASIASASILDYSGGQMTNFGAHSNDIAQWGMGADDTGPVEFEDLGSEWPPKGGLFNTATKIDFRARYANGVELICQTDQAGVRHPLRGHRGLGRVRLRRREDRAGVAWDLEDRPRRDPSAGEQRRPHGRASRRTTSPTTCATSSTASSRGRTRSSRSRSATARPRVCHLGNIAMLLKRKLRWDPAKEQFVGDDEANRMLDRPMRAPWQL